jgi:uncharacterized membrane protein
MNNYNLIGWILVVMFSLFNLFYNAYMHNKPKEGKYSFWVTLLSTLLNLILFLLVYLK